jgi:hypothetical protein
VTYIGEVVLKQRRVGGVRRVVVIEDDELLLLGALDDLKGALVQLGLDLVDDRQMMGARRLKTNMLTWLSIFSMRSGRTGIFSMASVICCTSYHATRKWGRCLRQPSASGA